MAGDRWRNRDLGVALFSPGTTGILTDVVVQGTLDQECETVGNCPWRIAGNLGSYVGASLTVTRFASRAAAFICVQVAEGATIDLHEGEVVDCPIGANVQVPDYDLARLADRVVFVDNDINLDTSGINVPPPIALGP